MPNRDQDERKDSAPKDSYSWLYEDDSRSGSKATGSHQTSSRGQSSRTRAESGSQQGRSSSQPLPPMNLPPAGSGRGTKPAPSGSGRGHRRRWPWVLLVLFVAWLVFLVAVPIWAWSKIDRVDASPEGNRPADQPGTTYLMVGSDSRRGLSKAEQKKLATGDDGGGRGRTDTIMLMHTGSGPTLLMSIPRDSLVDIPGHGTTKINAAFSYGGPNLLVKTIEQDTGIRIDDYVEVGFGGFVNVVNAVGGVEVCPKSHIKDKDAGINLDKGCQEVDGATALGYARSRHTYASQDLQRVQSQREVLGAIADKAKSPWTFVNPWRYAHVTDGAASSLRIGEDTGPISMARFAWNLSSAMGGDGLNCTVPIADTAVHWDSERAPKMFDLVKTDQTDKIGKGLCTKNGLPR